MGIAGSDDERNRRTPDITIWTSGNDVGVLVMDDDFIRLTLELMPGQRMDQNPLQLYKNVSIKGCRIQPSL